jgi:hypothetical protein
MATLPENLRTSKSPALPLGPTEYSRQYQDQLNSILRLYFGQIDNVLGSLLGPNGGRFLERPNGLFFNTADQTFASANVAYPVTYNATYLNNAVTLQSGSTSKIEVSISGIYNFQYSGQLLSTNASGKNVYLWIQRNDINIGYSTHAYTLSSNNEYTEINWNFIIDLAAGEYLELEIATTDTTVRLDAEAATAVHPGIASSVMAVSYIGPMPATRPTPP